MHQLGLLSFIVLLCLAPSYRLSQLNDELVKSQFIVWNVGQGQWTTWVQKSECWHFDVGGEFDFSSRVAQVCMSKINRIFLSHWDWDHVGLLARLKQKNLNLCLASAPLGDTSKKKLNLLSGLRACHNSSSNPISLFDPPLNNPKFQKKSLISANHLSSVFWIAAPRILIPGDSTVDEEHLWLQRTQASTRGLVLGHHGSKSSTSRALLDHLPKLRWAVSSARKSRYGHPHHEVIDRLAQKKIPLLRTEDWGTLHFYEN